MKKNIIALSGDLASGKGTISEILINELGYGIYRNGEYFRNLAKEHNMTLEEFGDYVAEHPDASSEVNWLRKHVIDSNDLLFDM